MLTLPRFALVASMVLALNAPAHAVGLTGTLADYGSTATVKMANRQITLNANSKYVNVEDGETVTIYRNGKSFTWTFQVFPTITNFELKMIAPQDFDASGIRVYVADNPLYRN